uniref:Endonuclease n=1 Tax=Xiphophorus maculatus TaxID=8083 RepID=A0A3B5RE98_XIPMA
INTHTTDPGNSGAVMKYGFPSLANVRSRESYVTSYDPRTRTASWVIERLNPASLTGPSDRKRCEFKEDDSVHVFHRATNADYRGSGFDRGHLAAAANHKWSQKAMEDTFYLSNVAPQNPHLNQNTWNNLEKLCRSLTKHYLNVYVCTGPLYLPRQEDDGKLYVRYQVIGRNHVAVPTHFFKVGVDRVMMSSITCLCSEPTWPRSPGADSGAGERPGGGASLLRLSQPAGGRQASSGAFPGFHRNHRASVGTAVRPEHHEADKQPAGHQRQVNYRSHNALLQAVGSPWGRIVISCSFHVFH